MKKTASLFLALTLVLSLTLPVSAAEETSYPVLKGGVQEIQKYGNLVLDIDPAEVEKGGYTYGDLLCLTVDGAEYEMPLCTNYSDVDTGSLVLRDSEGVLIAAINMGDFAATSGLAAKVAAEDGSYTWVFPEGKSLEDVSVTLSMKEPGGYYDQYLIHQLTRTDNRADYASDAVFANFRNVAVGKDRAGFASALLECLMGATYEEVVADYMTTYVNYYHLEAGSEQYEAVKNSNIVSILTTITGAKEGADLSKVDLAAAAADYIRSAGLTQAELDALQANLSKDYNLPTEETPAESPEETPAEEPAAQTPPQNTYTVASGDCLWSIAQKLYGTGTRWPELYEANRTIIHDPNQIQIGQVLTVPAA